MRLPDFSALPPIAVIGDVMLDHYIWGDASRISPEAPVPVVHVGRESFVPGGAANVALNLAALGVSVRLLGRVGEDAAARTLRLLLDQHNVEFAENWSSPACQTIRKTRVIAQRQQVCRVDRESPVADFALSDEQCESIPSMIAGCGAVILSDYAKGVLTPELVLSVEAARAQSGFLLAVDPKPRRALAYNGPDLMTPNRAEAAQLAELSLTSGEPFPAETVCDRIFARYAPQRLVITLGGAGMLLCESGTLLGRVPTMARDVFDVSGAGDTVIGALTAGLVAGLGLMEAAHMANAAAGIVVSKLGTATATTAEIAAELSRESSALRLISLAESEPF